jgi:NitT/TauT family transport system ATP-binding protein
VTKIDWDAKMPGCVMLMKNVSFSYGANQVLNSINISFLRNNTIGLLGSSGSGKSTILKLLSGLLKPTQGDICIDGLRPAEAAKAQRLGYLSQRATLFPWLTAIENVMLPLKLKESGNTFLGPFRGFRATQKERARAALEAAKVSGIEDRYPDELSGGMQTRVSLARMLVTNPPILLLDEPFTGLDDLLREELYADIQNVSKSINTTTIIVTHNIFEAIILCDKVIVIENRSSCGALVVMNIDINFERPRTMDLIKNLKFQEISDKIRSAYLSLQI